MCTAAHLWYSGHLFAVRAWTQRVSTFRRHFPSWSNVFSSLWPLIFRVISHSCYCTSIALCASGFMRPWPFFPTPWNPPLSRHRYHAIVHKFWYDADVFRVYYLTPVVHDPKATALIFVLGRKCTISIWYYLHDGRSTNISCSVHALVISIVGCELALSLKWQLIVTAFKASF
jgi:hypothetical protein